MALPRILGTRDLEVVAYEPGDPIRETSFGAREPTDGPVLDPEAVDLVVTPGVAFDRGHSTSGRPDQRATAAWAMNPKAITASRSGPAIAS